MILFFLSFRRMSFVAYSLMFTLFLFLIAISDVFLIFTFIVFLVIMLKTKINGRRTILFLHVHLISKLSLNLSYIFLFRLNLKKLFRFYLSLIFLAYSFQWRDRRLELIIIYLDLVISVELINHFKRLHLANSPVQIQFF